MRKLLDIKFIIKAGIAHIVVFGTILLLLTGCNQHNPEYNKAVVTLNDGTKIETEIEDVYIHKGGQVEITAKDGKKYLVSTYDIIEMEK